MPELRPNGSAWYLLSDGSVRNRLNGTAYDAAGNQTLLSIAYSGVNASYDAEGRVTQVTFGGVVATYDYDAEGRRVKRTDAAGAATYYVYDAEGQLMAEYGGTATGSGTQYVATDHLGSTRMVQDGQGNCVMRIDYAPYGAVVSRSGQNCYPTSTSWNGPMFAGADRDGDSGLDHMGAREYWATLGRFTSPDKPLVDQYPEDPQSWNLYNYVRSNPLVNIDPTGEDCVYTDDYNSEGTITIERGNCSKKGGTFIDGTIDTKSLTVRDGSLEFGYTDPNGAAGVHSMGLPSAPDLGLLALQRGAQFAERGVTITGVGLMTFMGGAFGMQAAPAVAATGRAALAVAATQAQNPVLRDIVSRLYQPQDKIPGGTAGAVRDHLAKGEWLSNSGHLTKVQQRITQLKRLSTPVPCHRGTRRSQRAFLRI